MDAEELADAAEAAAIKTGAESVNSALLDSIRASAVSIAVNCCRRLGMR